MNNIDKFIKKYGYCGGKKYPWTEKQKNDFVLWIESVFECYDIEDWFTDPGFQIKGYYLKALLNRKISLGDEEFFLPLKDMRGEFETAMVLLLYNIVKKGSHYRIISVVDWKKNLRLNLKGLQSRSKVIKDIYLLLGGDVNYLHTKEEKQLLKYYLDAILKYWAKNSSIINSNSISQVKKEMEKFVSNIEIKDDTEYANAFSRIKEMVDKGITRPNEYYKEKYGLENSVIIDCKLLEASGNSDALLLVDVVRKNLSQNSRKYFYGIVDSVKKIAEMLRGKSFDNVPAIDVFHEVPFVGTLYDGIIDYCNRNDFNKVRKYLTIKIRPVIVGNTVNINNETGDWIISGTLVPQAVKETAYNQVLHKYNLEKVPLLLYKDEVLRIMKERGEQ